MPAKQPAVARRCRRHCTNRHLLPHFTRCAGAHPAARVLLVSAHTSLADWPHSRQPVAACHSSACGQRRQQRRRASLLRSALIPRSPFPPAQVPRDRQGRVRGPERRALPRGGPLRQGALSWQAPAAAAAAAGSAGTADARASPACSRPLFCRSTTLASRLTTTRTFILLSIFGSGERGSRLAERRDYACVPACAPAIPADPPCCLPDLPCPTLPLLQPDRGGGAQVSGLRARSSSRRCAGDGGGAPRGPARAAPQPALATLVYTRKPQPPRRLIPHAFRLVPPY